MTALTDARLIFKALKAAELGAPAPTIRKMMTVEAAARPDATIQKGLVFEDGKAVERPIPATNPDKRIIRFDLSVEGKDPDRQGHRVMIKGWDLTDYVRNGVVLWSHQNIQLPVGKNVGIGPQGKRLVQAAQFAEHEFANDVHELAQQGFLRGWSPGFIPKKWQLREDPDPGVDFVEQVLIESSICNVPANADALSHISGKSVDPEILETANLLAELKERFEKIDKKLDEVLGGRGSKDYAGELRDLVSGSFGRLGV